MLLTSDTKSGHDTTMRMLQYTIDPYSGWDPLHTRCDVLRIRHIFVHSQAEFLNAQNFVDLLQKYCLLLMPYSS